MSDVFAVPFGSVTETEGFPNNFRRAVLGRELGVNQIRWVHPTELPVHAHPDAEQAVVVTEGEVEFSVDGQVLRLIAGDVLIIPRHVVHSGRSTGADAQFIEIFAPGRVENLAGFLGNQSPVTGD